MSPGASWLGTSAPPARRRASNGASSSLDRATGSTAGPSAGQPPRPPSRRPSRPRPGSAWRSRPAPARRVPAPLPAARRGARADDVRPLGTPGHTTSSSRAASRVSSSSSSHSDSDSNTVTSSWRPSTRTAPSSKHRLTFAGARASSLTAAASPTQPRRELRELRRRQPLGALVGRVPELDQRGTRALAHTRLGARGERERPGQRLAAMGERVVNERAQGRDLPRRRAVASPTSAEVDVRGTG